jgi:dihydrofolate synthase/folylpolyglutamate synthase
MASTATKQGRTRRTTKSRAKTPRSRTKQDGAAIRNYRSALNFLKTKTNYENMVRVNYNSANFNRARMLRVLGGLDNPHREYKTIHIAGTKGKGSTAHMLAAMLMRAGYRTGLYTSPHFVTLRERISFGGQMVSEPEFTKLMARVAPVAAKLNKDDPTFFELMTAAAFLHFANKQADVAVIETGLGGRLDSTNVIKPEVCAITSISYDHTAQLGTTLEAIAEEKAGIFKPGVPAISAPQPSGVKRVLRDQAKKTGCDLRFVGDELEFSYRFERSHVTGPHTRVCMATPTTRFDHIQVPLLGEHQAHNCGVALAVVDALRGRGLEVSAQDAIDGLAEVRVQGRLETIREMPHTIVDAAHNAASIRALMRAIGQNVGYDSMVVIFGCSADKDIDGMLDQLQIGADKVIFTGTGTSRSADPQELLARFQEKSHKMAQVEESLLDAYQVACNCVSREDLVCITGSVHLVGHAKQKLAGENLS